MYLIEKFSGNRFGRLNALIEGYVGQLSSYVNLIASTSYPFSEVQSAMGMPFTVFPTEGLPGQRYFPTGRMFDEIEELAQSHLATLFGYGSDFRSTIQPHSCTQANQIVFGAVLSPGDAILSLDPSCGGHVSHTAVARQGVRVMHYHVTPDGFIDYDEVASLALAHAPNLIVAGASSYSRIIDYEQLSTIARRHGALLHADVSHTALFYMAGRFPKLFPSADFATFNPVKNLRGPSGGVLIYRADLQQKVARAIFPLVQSGPLETLLFAKLVCLEILAGMDLPTYADTIVRISRAMAQRFLDANIPVVSGGTDNHLFVVDLGKDGPHTGASAEDLCERARILVNRNLVPFDTRKPRTASGIRIGATCLTNLGVSIADAERVAGTVVELLAEPERASPDAMAWFAERYLGSFNGANAAKERRDNAPLQFPRRSFL